MARCDTTIGICADGTRARTELQKTKQSTEKFSSGVGKSLKKIALMAGAAGGAYLAMRKLGNFLKSSLKAYQDQEIANTKLATALKSTGRYSKTTEDALHDFAQEMQETTGISNDLIVAASGVMTTFTNIGTETFPEALEAAANMSKMFGQDLQQSVIQLGTALNDPITGLGRLKRIGISFTEDQKESVKQFVAQNDIMSAQRVILDELTVEIGGVAKALGQTYAGQVDVLKGAMGDLKKVMGGLMADAITPMLPMITSIITSAEAWLTSKQNLKQAYIDLERIAKTSLANITQAEIDATIQLLVKDQKFLEARQKVVWEEIQLNKQLLSPFKSLTKEYLELTGKLELLENQLRTYVNLLVLEVTVSDELLAKYGLLKKGVEGNVEPVEDLTDAIEEYWNTLEEGEWDWIIDMYESQAAAADELGDAVSLLGVRLHGFKQDNIDVGESIDATTELLKKQAEALKDLRDNVLYQFKDAWVDVWVAVGDESITVKEVVKDLLSSLLISLSEYLLAMAVLYAIARQWGKMAKALAGSAAAAVSSGIVQNLQQGGIVGGGYGGGDKQIIAAEEGEMVMRKEVVRTNRSALEAMNAGEQGVAMVNVYLGTRKIYSELTQAMRNKQINVYKGALTNK